MPLPFILVGAAVALAGVGTKKGYDGYQDKAEANNILEVAKKQYEKAASDLEFDDKGVQDKLEELGTLQLDIGKDFNEFQVIAEELLGKLNDASKADIKVDVPKYQRKRIERLSMDSIVYASKVVGGSAAAGYAVYGGVLGLAAASTGAPISALSGVAAYNATMAAIGGGSLAAGGLGMAGGAAILGGIVAAPALAIAGWAFASHAEEALSKAKETREEVRQFVKETDISRGYLRDTRQYISRIILGLNGIRKVFNNYLKYLKAVEAEMGQGNFDILEKEKDIILKVKNGYVVAAILTDIITTPLFKVEENNGVPVVGKDGIPKFETNDEGSKILNKNNMTKVIGESNRSVEQFKN
ncbi:chemotaxis protein [Psychrobacter piscatorii]|uniref:chemotaxis protein n=1 Tax=Psychrobacter piscatorii TaxID=554343 RepID=UPI003736A348